MISNENSQILLLIKIFDNEAYADSFLNDGEMYCRTLEEFKKSEDKQRGDIYEGVGVWHQPKDVIMKISFDDNKSDEVLLKEEDLAGPVVIQSNNLNHLNLYCMYAVKMPPFVDNFETETDRLSELERINNELAINTKLSDDVVSIGQFAVVVYQPQTFIDRVMAKAKDEQLEFKRASINYYDPETFSGTLDGWNAVFSKRNIYSHQREHRFLFIPPKPKGDLTLRIGSIKDIAWKINTADINTKLQLNLGLQEG